MELPINLPELLTFITGAAGIAWWCTVVSDYYRNKGAELLEGIQAFWRQVIVYATMASLPVAGYLITQFVPASFLEAAAPHFEFAMIVLTAMLAARGVYEFVKHRPESELFAYMSVATPEERAVLIALADRMKENKKPLADALEPAA